MLTFSEVLHHCAAQPEFVKAFDRLHGTHLATLDSRTAIDAMIDEATGRDREAALTFAAFVAAYVWPYANP